MSGMRKLLAIAAVAGLGMALSPTQGLALVNLTTQTATGTSTTGSPGTFDATATCPSGFSVTGGGYSVPSALESAHVQVNIYFDGPNGSNGWEVRGEPVMGNPSGYTFTSYAICGEVI